jgi:hypothetical protein
MSLIDNILDAREKPISDTTRKLYNRHLKKLNDDNEVVSLDFLNDPKLILKKISHLAPNTQKTYIIAICAILRNSIDTKLYVMYFRILKDLNSELSVNTTKNQKQKDNWMTVDEIIKFRENMKLDLRTFDLMLNYLIVCLYTMIAPRRNIDYTLMKISNDMSDSNFNYIDIKNKKFIFNNYKTSGTYHSVEIDIPNDLMEVTNQYLKMHPNRLKIKNKKYSLFLFGNEFSSDNLSKRISKIFGKRIGSSMLRNIYLTDKYSTSIKGLENDAKKMGTSINTALNNYIKKS